jgi:uncharacterized membrane protein
MAFCTKCGAQFADGAAFCGSCGAPQGSAASGAPPAPAASSGGLDANIAAALAYLWLPAILWLVLEPYNKDRFIRFHSFQSLAFGVAALVVQIALGMIPLLGWIVAIPVSLLILLVWVVCLFKAFSKDWFKLPVIGDWAMQQAGPAQ